MSTQHLIKGQKDGLPAIIVVDDEYRETHRHYQWHLSVIINYRNCRERGMPSREDVAASVAIEETLNQRLGDNAVFFARITWNKTRQLLYRVLEPETANEALQKYVREPTHPLPFDFEMRFDAEEVYIKWFLDTAPHSLGA